MKDDITVNLNSDAESAQAAILIGMTYVYELSGAYIWETGGKKAFINMASAYIRAGGEKSVLKEFWPNINFID